MPVGHAATTKREEYGNWLGSPKARRSRFGSKRILDPPPPCKAVLFTALDAAQVFRSQRAVAILHLQAKELPRPLQDEFRCMFDRGPTEYRWEVLYSQAKPGIEEQPAKPASDILIKNRKIDLKVIHIYSLYF